MSVKWSVELSGGHSALPREIKLATTKGYNLMSVI